MKQPLNSPILSLTDYGLKKQMTVREVLFTLEALKTRIGIPEYEKQARLVIHNLNQMKPGTSFDYRKYFTGKKLEVFLVVAHRFMVEHMDYEFSDDYSLIRRTH